MNRARVFHIVSREKDDNGNILLSEDKIKTVIQKYTSIQKAVWIKHDKDMYMKPSQEEADVIYNIRHFEAMAKNCGGEDNLSEETRKDLDMARAILISNKTKYETERTKALKPPHFHIVLQLSTANTVANIAKWFGIPENFIDVPKGNNRTKFYDCARYLTHESEKEQAKGKYRYPDEDIHAIGFNFREELDNIEKVIGNKSYAELQEEIMKGVLDGRYTLKEIRLQYPELYIKNPARYTLLRKEYLNNAPMPDLRINYYINGAGGIGKNLCSKALARQLAKMIKPNLVDDEDIFFEVGANNVSFQDYNGQPVIIWNDFRSYELMQALGSKGNIYDVFDTTPSRRSQNIKYGSVRLINYFNIVNSVEPYKTFLNNLAGEYRDRYGIYHNAEDKGQIYRRFPIILPLDYDSFSVILNKGVFFDTAEYDTLLRYKQVSGSFATMYRLFGGMEEEIKLLEEKTLEIPVERTKYLIASRLPKSKDEELEELYEVLKVRYGQPIEERKEPTKEEQERFYETIKKFGWVE